MSFAIRPIYKARNVHSLSDIDVSKNEQDNEEVSHIISTIKKFSNKSSHENLLTSSELENILKTSSINPDTNPKNKKTIDKILKGKKTSSIVSIEDTSESHGFSGSSLGAFGNTVRNSRMENELHKELDSVRSKYKKKDDDREIPDDIRQQIESMKSNEVEVIPEDEEDDNRNENTTNLSEEKRNEIQCRRVLSYSHPARASLARGVTLRTHSMNGMGIKRVPMGISDMF